MLAARAGKHLSKLKEVFSKFTRTWGGIAAD